MKIKNILSLAVIAGVTLFASSAYAATESYSVGTPIDLATGNAVEEYKVGQIVALPVDFESSTGSIKATGISLNFDSNVLSYGADLTAITSDSTMISNLMALGEVKFNSDSSKVMLVNGLYNKNVLTGAITGVGTMNVPDSDTNGKVKIPWASGASVATKATPELYIIFTVNGTISNDSLNVDVVTVNDSECNIGDTENHLNVSGTIDKANACAAAFQVDVDNDALATSGFWIQKLYAKVGDTTQDLTICNNTEGTATYSFPTRILTNTTGNDDLTVDVYATVTTDEAGTANAADVKVGTFNLTADGTATNYGTATTITGIDK